MWIKERKPYHYKLYLVITLIKSDYTFQNLLEKTPRELLNIAFECIDVARTHPRFEYCEVDYNNEILMEGKKYYQPVFTNILFGLSYVVDVKKTIGFIQTVKDCDLINVINSDINSMSNEEKELERLRGLVNKLQLDQERLNEEISIKEKRIEEVVDLNKMITKSNIIKTAQLKSIKDVIMDNK